LVPRLGKLNALHPDIRLHVGSAMGSRIPTAARIAPAAGLEVAAVPALGSGDPTPCTRHSDRR
jgi:hypothetical protein